MEKEEALIPASEFCTCHNIEYAFISSLENSGLVTITSVKHTAYIPAGEVSKLEKYIRMHYDLDINIEGIETICHLLEKIEGLQQELLMLRNKLG